MNQDARDESQERARVWVAFSLTLAPVGAKFLALSRERPGHSFHGLGAEGATAPETLRQTDRAS